MRRSLAVLFVMSAVTVGAADISKVDDFGYQLQNYPPALTPLIQSKFDLIVMDYSLDGSEEGEFTAEQLQAIQNGGVCGGKIVLAYFSIGEAESYRYYFNPAWIDASGNPVPGVAPVWLGPTNPEWEGNYKVRYWNPQWKAIVYRYLDRIIDQGFDGVYLDIIDAFEYWGPFENGGNNERRNSAKLMIDFVRQIAQHARVKRAKPGFLIVPQNGTGLIADWSYPDALNPVAQANLQKTRYFQVINAIGAEDTFFSGNQDNNNPYRPDFETMALLDQFRNAGKTVLATDYLTNPQKIRRFYTEARGHGYVPYATIRSLGRLKVNPAFPPDCD